MFSLSSLRLSGALALALVSAALAAPASAASIGPEITGFARSDLAGARSALAAYQSGADRFAGTGQQVKSSRTETFEGHRAWNGVSGAADPSDTNVGRFATLGGHGTGASAIDGGRSLAVRQDDPFRWGRQDTSGADGKWLDSNDTYGLKWEAGGGPAFNSLAFLLTDVADAGARFSLKVGGTVYSDLLGADGKLGNGTIHLVRILLPEAVSSLTLEMRHDRLNDGFGIDGATVAKIAPIPVPPAAALLLTGIAALAGFRRRQRAAPAA